MKVAGSSVLLGPTATSLMLHLRMGKPSLAGGRSLRICCEVRLAECCVDKEGDIPTG